PPSRLTGEIASSSNIRSRLDAPMAGRARRKSPTRIVPAAEAASAPARSKRSWGLVTLVARSRLRAARSRRAATARAEALTRSTTGSVRESPTTPTVLLRARAQGGGDISRSRRQYASALARQHLGGERTEDHRKLLGTCPLRAKTRCQDRRTAQELVTQTK